MNGDLFEPPEASEALAVLLRQYKALQPFADSPLPGWAGVPRILGHLGDRIAALGGCPF